MNDDLESDAEMERYLVCVAALHRLMQAEQTLISSIIPTQYQHQVFEKTIREAMDLIVQDGEVTVKLIICFFHGNYSILKVLKAVVLSFVLILTWLLSPSNISGWGILKVCATLQAK